MTFDAAYTWRCPEPKFTKGGWNRQIEVSAKRDAVRNGCEQGISWFSANYETAERRANRVLIFSAPDLFAYARARAEAGDVEAQALVMKAMGGSS